MSRTEFGTPSDRVDNLQPSLDSIERQIAGVHEAVHARHVDPDAGDVDVNLGGLVLERREPGDDLVELALDASLASMETLQILQDDVIGAVGYGGLSESGSTIHGVEPETCPVWNRADC